MTFDPYSQWLSIPAGPRPPSHYRLLRVPAEEAHEERIREAGNGQYARVKRNELSGAQGHRVAGLRSEIARAMDCLADPQRRAAYREQWLREAVAYWLRSDRAPADAYELLEEFGFTPAQHHLRQSLAAARRCLDEAAGDGATSARADEIRGLLDAAEAALADPAAYEAYHRPLIARLQGEAAKKFGGNRRRWDGQQVAAWLAEEQWIHPARAAQVAEVLGQTRPDEQQRLLREMFPRSAPPVRAAEKAAQSALPVVVAAIPSPEASSAVPVVPVAAAPLPPVKAIATVSQEPVAVRPATQPAQRAEPVKKSEGGVPWYISCSLIGATLLGAWLVVRPHLNPGDAATETAFTEEPPGGLFGTSKTAPKNGETRPKPPVPAKPDAAPAVGSAWKAEGLLMRLVAHKGEVHLLVSSPNYMPPNALQPAPPAAGPSASAVAFEAFSDEPEFDAELADYYSLRECGRAERVEIEGAVCDPGDAGFRLSAGVPLVRVKQIQKPGLDATRAVVGGPKRTTIAPPGPPITGLSRLLRSPPAPNAEVAFSCYVQSTGASERTLSVSPSSDPPGNGLATSDDPTAPAQVIVRLLGSDSRPMPSPGAMVEVVARVAASGPTELALDAGDWIPSLTPQKERWRTARQDANLSPYRTLALAGVFQSRGRKFSQTLQAEQPCVTVRKLFWEDESLEAFYFPSPAADRFLEGLQDGDRLLLSVQRMQGRQPAAPTAAPEYVVTLIARPHDPQSAVALSSNIDPGGASETPEPLLAAGRRLGAHTSQVTSMGFSPDGKYLASTGGDGRLKVWNAATFEEYAVGGTLGSNSALLAWWGRPGQSDWMLVTGGDDETVKGWKVVPATRSVPQFGQGIPIGQKVTCLAWDKDGTHLAVGTQDGVLLVYEVRPRAGMLQIVRAPRRIPLQTALTAAAWRPAPVSQLAVGNGSGLIWIIDTDPQRAKTVWRPGNAPAGVVAKPGRRPDAADQRDEYCCHLAWTPDGKTLTALQPTLQFWNVSSAGAMSRIEIEVPVANARIFAPAMDWDGSGNFLAVATANDTIAVWRKDNATRMAAVRQFRGPLRVYSLQFSPDGTRLAAGSFEGAVYVYLDPTQPAPAGAAPGGIPPVRPPRPVDPLDPFAPLRR